MVQYFYIGYDPLNIVSFFILGCILGSFFNVVALRLPLNKTFVTGRSQCPSCSHTITAKDLLPVISFVFLKGKCRYCKVGISPYYPLFELLTGGIFALSYYVAQGHAGLLWFYLTLSTMFIILSHSDLKYMIVPDLILVVFAPVLVFMGVYIYSHQVYIEGIIIMVAMLLLFFMSQGKMGGGDIKIFILLGFTFGLDAWLYIFFFSVFLGFFIGLLFKIKHRKLEGVPFVPFIAVATLFYTFFPDVAWNLYSNFYSLIGL